MSIVNIDILLTPRKAEQNEAGNIIGPSYSYTYNYTMQKIESCIKVKLVKWSTIIGNTNLANDENS